MIHVADDDRTTHTPSTSWPLTPYVHHIIIVIFLYIVSLGIAISVYRFPEAKTSIVAILATGSIFGTMGSAIMTVFGLWERDLQERIKLDLDILNREILENPTPWRRWPFLKRSVTWHFYDGTTMHVNLINVFLTFNVGSHYEKILVPSVPEDFYDLPCASNLWRLWWFRRSFMTKQKNDRQRNAFPEISQYECVYDIWKCVAYFRLARYGLHLGIGLIFFGVVMTAYHILKFSPPINVILYQV